MSERLSVIIKDALVKCDNDYAKALEMSFEAVREDEKLLEETLTEFISAKLSDLIRGNYSTQREHVWNNQMSPEKYRGMVDTAKKSILDYPLFSGKRLRDAVLNDIKKAMNFHYEHGKTNLVKYIWYRQINDALEEAKVGSAVTVGSCMSEEVLDRFMRKAEKVRGKLDRNGVKELTA